MATFQKLRLAHGLLKPKTRRGFWILLFLYLVSGIVQTLSVASIGPFLAVSLDPESFLSSPIGRSIAETFELNSGSELIIVFGLATLSLVIVSQAMSLWLENSRLRWSHNCEAELSAGLMENFLRRRFDYFATRHSSEISQVVLHEASRVARMVIFPTVVAITRLFLVAFMVALLAIIDPVISLTAAMVLAVVYGLIAFVLSAKLGQLGSVLQKKSVARFVIAGELLAGIKEIKLRSMETASGSFFKKTTYEYARVGAKSEFLKLIPKPVIEMLLFSGVIVTICAVVLSGHDLTSIIPKASIFLFAAYRIVPNAQLVFQSVSSVRINQPFLDSVLKEWNVESDGEVRDPVAVDHRRAKELADFAEISLREVGYSYPSSDRSALDDLSMSIIRNECVGIIGKSGAGKSTVLDVLLGLLKPHSGSLDVDGEPLNSSDVALWRNLVGYVSQAVYLSDDTIAANIAFGEKEIDQARVEQAARLASIDEYIEGLPEGYDTPVGESGGRLSGGQKQRLAIARALYRDPPVLILDEATSALDTETETRIMGELKNLVGTRTIVIVAHRVSTLANCDRVFEMSGGKVVAEIKPEALPK
ncbi:MAG: ABC transporter ATP-binding protein [Pseudomonadota bacterium]